MKTMEELFKVELGRVRSIAEVRAVADGLRPYVAAYEKSFKEACDMPWTPGLPGEPPRFSEERTAAFEKHDEEYSDGVDYAIALQGLNEILPELEALEKEIPPDIPEDKQPAVQKIVEEAIGKIAESGIRNARHWLGVFGSDSYIRVDVFSWIAGVAPNYEELEDATEREEEMFKSQVDDMVQTIRGDWKTVN